MPFSNNSFVLYNDKQDELIYVIWIKENKDNKYFFKNLGHMKKLNIKDVGERIVFTTYPNINTTFFLSHTEFMKDKNNIKVADEKIIDIFKKYNHFHIHRILNSLLRNPQSGGSGNAKTRDELMMAIVSYHHKHVGELQALIDVLKKRVEKIKTIEQEIRDATEGPKMIRQDDFDEIISKISEDENSARKIQSHIVNDIFPDLNKDQESSRLTDEMMISLMRFYSEQSEEIKKILLFYHDFKNFISEFNANRIKRNKKNKNRKKQKKKNKKKKEEAGKKISQFLESRFRGIKSRERTNDLAPFPSGTPNFETVLAQTKEEFPQLKGGKKKYSLKRGRKHKYTKAKRKRFRKSKKKKRRKIKTRRNK